MNWQQEAACSGHPELAADFFPEGRYERNSKEYRAAVARVRAICAGCPVRRECLDYAVEHHLTDGIWGGLTSWQRKGQRWPRRWVNGRLVYVHDAEARGA